jgi:hypothetical protein
MTSDRQTFLEEENASAKRNLMSVGGCVDTPVDVDTTGNTDGKRPWFGNGQTVLMRTSTQDEFVKCWRESIIRNSLASRGHYLPPDLADDPLFQKGLVTTSLMGQTTVCMGKGTALGKRDTTLPHRQTFTRKIIPVTDKRLDQENMTRLNLPQTTWIDWSIEGWIHSQRRNRLDQKIVEKLVHTHTNLVLRESLDDELRDLLPWDIEFVIDPIICM